jgi:hypothetical protein
MKLSMRLTVRHIFLALALGALLLPAATFAQMPGKHPAYLHALSDLRMARAYLETATDQYSVQAKTQIEDAINDLKKAAIDDGKNISDHPPIDAQVAKTNRFKKTQELLNQAHADVDREEDDPAARGLKTRILGHIDSAHGFIDQALAAGLR